MRLVNVGYTILMVEDTADSRQVMRLVLAAQGYRVLEAADGVVAVDLASENSHTPF